MMAETASRADWQGPSGFSFESISTASWECGRRRAAAASIGSVIPWNAAAADAAADKCRNERREKRAMETSRKGSVSGSWRLWPMWRSRPRLPPLPLNVAFALNSACPKSLGQEIRYQRAQASLSAPHKPPLLPRAGHAHDLHAGVRRICNRHRTRPRPHPAWHKRHRECTRGMRQKRCSARRRATWNGGIVATPDDARAHGGSQVVGDSHSLRRAGCRYSLRRKCERRWRECKRQRGSSLHVENLLANRGRLAHHDRATDAAARSERRGKRDTQRAALARIEQQAVQTRRRAAAGRREFSAGCNRDERHRAGTDVLHRNLFVQIGRAH